MGQLAAQIRAKITSPVSICTALGLMNGAKKQANGLLIRCPKHGEKDASCSITAVGDGVRVKCFACDFKGDSLVLIAQMHGLTLSGTDFFEVLALAADYSGDSQAADGIRKGNRDVPLLPPKRAPAERVEGVRTYPPIDEVRRVWESSKPLSACSDSVSMFLKRGIDPGAVEDLDLARIAPRELPRWASYRGNSWYQTHRVLVRSSDHFGATKSLRAWAHCPGDFPKRLPPAGYRGSGLVQANDHAKRGLAGSWKVSEMYIVEGEPDFLVMSARFPDSAVVGIGSGSWSNDFAKRIDTSTRIVVATHNDPAGDKYAASILETLKNHPYTWRWKIGR